MNDPREAPNSVPWPPVIYAAAIAVAVVLHFLVPLPWLGSPAPDLLFAIGWLLVAAVVAIVYSALKAFRRAGTSVSPVKASSHLIASGPFAFTRNPLYLSNTLLMIGIGLIVGGLWFLALAIVAAFATQKLAIEPEERHLEARFGKAYRDYRKKVRRWI